MKRLSLIAALGLLVILTACTRGALEPNAITYALEPVNDSGVEGFVTFEKMSETETAVTIDVEGTTAGVLHPAHIHVGDTTTNGAVYVPLESVEGDTGTSTTIVTENLDGEPVTYEDLVNFDGYVNIHASPEDLTVISTGETGEGANDVQIPEVLSLGN